MRFAFSFVITASVLLTSASLSIPMSGCSSDDKTCSDYSPPADFNATTPAVSFSKDVFPIFAQSCAFTSCHGSTTGSSNGIFLGGSDPKKVHDAIVDVRSSKLGTMSYVKAGDPRESFMMRKMDGSQCVLNAQCTEGDCGQSMPRNDETLPLATRDTVRRWIAQGAKND